MHLFLELSLEASFNNANYSKSREFNVKGRIRNSKSNIFYRYLCLKCECLWFDYTRSVSWSRWRSSRREIGWMNPVETVKLPPWRKTNASKRWVTGWSSAASLASAGHYYSFVDTVFIFLLSINWSYWKLRRGSRSSFWGERLRRWAALYTFISTSQGLFLWFEKIVYCSWTGTAASQVVSLHACKNRSLYESVLAIASGHRLLFSGCPSISFSRTQHLKNA